MARRGALRVWALVLGSLGCAGAWAGCQLLINDRPAFLESDAGGGGAGTCSDGTECGGPGCPRCGDGKACTQGTDCRSGLCNGTCQSNDVWAKHYGNGADQQANAIAVDAVGDALVTGKVSGTVDFGNGPQPTAPAASPFLATLDPSGKALGWSRVFPDVGSGGEGMAVSFATLGSAVGAVFVGGRFNGALGFPGDAGAAGTDDAGDQTPVPDGGLTTSAFESPFRMSVLPPTGFVYEQTYSGSAGMYAQTVTGILAGGSNSSLFMTGYANGADFGCGPISYPHESSLFLTGSGTSGKCTWSTTFGGNAHATASITLDATGNVVIAGGFRNLGQVQGAGTLDFGNGYQLATAAQGLTAIFIAKINPATGQGMWARSFGDASGGGTATAVAVDATGNVFVTGTFTGTIDFGDGPLTAKGSTAVFAAKRAGSGDHIWSKAFGDANVTSATAPVGLALDASGSVVIAGHFDGSLDFGGGALTSMGATDVFAVKLDTMGGHLWSRSYGDAQKQTSAGVAIAPSGDLLLAGTFAGQIDFGGGPLASAGGTDIFVARLHTP